MIASVALAAGFGLNLETCDPEIFEALIDLLEDQNREAQRQRLEADLKSMRGR